MSDLLEHILSEDYVSAGQLFEERLNNIVEKKLYEMKKNIQAEAFGALSKADIEARRKAGYRKASEVLDDPYDRPMTMIGKEKSSETKSKPRRRTKLKLKEDSPPPASAAALANINRIANLKKAEKFQQTKQSQDVDHSKDSEDWKQFKTDYSNKKAKEAKRAEFIKKYPGRIAKHMVLKGAEAIGHGVARSGSSIVKGLARSLAANSPLNEDSE